MVLAWHVDYWDRLGWKDPFADKSFTARQRAYIPRLETRGLVTPQILIGNNRAPKEWGQKIKEEGAKPARLLISAVLEMELDADPEAGSEMEADPETGSELEADPEAGSELEADPEAGSAMESGRLTVKVGLSEPARAPDAEPTDELPPTAVVRVVLFQKQAVTEVATGENAGKTLTEFFVVRKLCDPIAAVRALAEPQVVTLKLPEGVEKENLGLAVLVEDSKRMNTIEAAVFDLP